MRASLLLSAAIVASMPQLPVPLSLEAPQLLIQNRDCAAAKLQAQALAAGLGFAQTRMSCGYGLTTVALVGRSPAQIVTPNGIITYSVFGGPPLPPQVSSAFEVPSDVPFVATSGDIAAYTKLDAMVLLLQTHDILKTAFALEEAGVPRGEMISLPGNNAVLVVRVRPITISRLLQIMRTIAADENSNSNSITKIGFVRDCDRTIASLGGLALEEAQRRANVVARAAQTELGNAIGVVDPGGNVTDAICGFGDDATTHQLAVAAQNTPLPGAGNSHLYATFVRSIRAARRIKGLANGIGAPWGLAGGFGNADKSAFIANGVRVSGDALVANSVQPNRVSILVPDWSYDSMLRSAYSKYLSYIDFGIGQLRLSVTIQDRNAEELQKNVAGFQRYFSTLAQRLGKPADLSFRYSQTDCGPAIEAALFRATRLGLVQAEGKPIRYVQQGSTGTIGSVSCAFEPADTDQWSNNSAPKPGASLAGVVAAY